LFVTLRDIGARRFGARKLNVKSAPAR